MGRVNPPKVFEGASVTDGTVNDGVSAFRSQADNIDALNLRGESLGPRQLRNKTFVRDFSYWSGMGPSVQMDGHTLDGSGSALIIPRWLAGASSKNGLPEMATGKPHVVVSNNPDDGDVSIVRASCGLYVRDYGFQTYRRSYKNRFKGPIIKVFIGHIDPDATGIDLTDTDDYTKIQNTIQWFQLPWSGAKWNTFAEPFGGGGPGLYSGLTSSSLPEGNFDGWYTLVYGQRQFVPTLNHDDQGGFADPISPKAFDYNFNFHATFAWKPGGSGDRRNMFVLMCLATFDTPGDPPFWDAEINGGSEGTEITFFEDRTGDGIPEKYFAEASAPWRFVRHGVYYPGFFLRNCTMNAVTYSGGR